MGDSGESKGVVLYRQVSLLWQRKKRGGLIGSEILNLSVSITEQVCYDLGRAIPGIDTNHLWRCTSQETQVMKIFILGDDCQSVLDRVLPHNRIRCPSQSDIPDVNARRKKVSQQNDEFG